MKKPFRLGLFVLLTAALAIAAAPSTGGASVTLPWQTGISALANGATVEPAVDLSDGTQTFLLTPNHAPFYDGSATPDAPVPRPFNRVNAPLYLVTYPIGSTADAAAPFNCYTEGAFDPSGQLPYNCDHAQIPGIKGHDHLVGDPGSKTPDGDYNVPWHVWVTLFTPKGIADGASNTRILTLAQLKAAQAAGDVTPFIDSHIYFMCAAVSGAVYRNGTPLSFPPLPAG
jgi:hypothetical protein